MNISELETIYDCRKSFYGKALEIRTDNGVYLQSYNSIICKVNYGLNGEVIIDNSTLWTSNTSLRHLKEFLKQNTHLEEKLNGLTKGKLEQYAKDNICLANDM